jgi:hypothetical protein
VTRVRIARIRSLSEYRELGCGPIMSYEKTVEVDVWAGVGGYREVEVFSRLGMKVSKLGIATGST